MTLNKLEPSKHKQGRWLAYLSDGTLLRLSESDVVSLSLYSGMELEDEVLATLHSAELKSKTREKALELINARPYSRKELEKKLKTRDLDEKAISETADWLEDLGFLNDEEYAKQVVRYYSGKGYGVRKIRDELYQRGVPRAYWDDALEEKADSTDAIDRFLRQKLGGIEEPDRKTIKKVTDALARRGFSWQEISEGLRRFELDVLDD